MAAARRGVVGSVGPSVGGEIRKTRPAVVISGDHANRSLNRVQVVPITSSTGRLYSSEAYVILKGQPYKAVADQLTTVSKLRLRNRVARLDSIEVAAIEQAIRVQLAL
jgi:mRNA interferase MazF